MFDSSPTKLLEEPERGLKHVINWQYPVYYRTNPYIDEALREIAPNLWLANGLLTGIDHFPRRIDFALWEQSEDPFSIFDDAMSDYLRPGKKVGERIVIQCQTGSKAGCVGYALLRSVFGLSHSNAILIAFDSGVVIPHMPTLQMAIDWVHEDQKCPIESFYDSDDAWHALCR